MTAADEPAHAPLPALAGARVRRVDMPSRSLLSVTLACGGARETLVVSTAPSDRGVGLVPDRPRGEPASSFVRKLRKELAGGTVIDARPAPATLLLRIRRGDEERTVACELSGPGNVVLLDAGGRVLVARSASALRARGLAPGAQWSPFEGGAALPPVDLDRWRARGAELVRGDAADDLERLRRSLDRAVASATRRVERKILAIAADAARAEEVPRLRADAQALLAALHGIPAGASEATVMDYHADPPALRTVAIDPARGARAQVDAWFHRARRLERGTAIAAQRLREAEAERASLSSLRQALGDAADEAAIRALAGRARALGVRGAADVASSPRAARGAPGPRLPWRRFVGQGGREILVGRGAADNDALTLRHARPHHLWLHARGRTGGHVVVPLAKNEACPPELLVDAAHLAAHFSDARGEEVVEVQHTPRRYVRKARGLPPGAVLVDREKVITLRVEPARLLRLLATEA